MDNARFIKLVIIALLLINISTLAFMWLGKPHEMGPPPPGGGGGPYGFLVRELKLDDKQQEQYKKLRDAHHEAMEGYNHKSRELHDHLFQLIHAATVDSMTITQATDSIAANQKREDLLTFYHFRDVRALCTPEQQKKFDAIIEDAMHMMGAKPPPPPR